MRYVDCVIWVMYGFELWGFSTFGRICIPKNWGPQWPRRDGPPVMYGSSNGVHFLTSVQENTGEIDHFGQGRWYDGKNQKVYLFSMTGRKWNSHSSLLTLSPLVTLTSLEREFKFVRESFKKVNLKLLRFVECVFLCIPYALFKNSNYQFHCIFLRSSIYIFQ